MDWSASLVRMVSLGLGSRCALARQSDPAIPAPCTFFVKSDIRLVSQTL